MLYIQAKDDSCRCIRSKHMMVLFAIIIVLTGCSTNAISQLQVDSIGKVEIYDSSANSIINPHAQIEIIGRNYTWAEGPVWIAEKQMLLFSDVPENKIYSWKPGHTPEVFLMPSGYTGTTPRKGEIGSNGLALDNKGRLLICQDGDRQVVRLNATWNDPKPWFAILSNKYKGKKYNSPNDIAVSKSNNIYFTDPVYGLPEGAGDATRELNFEGVFKIDRQGKTSLLIDSISRPNGIALSPDETTLYVASSDDVHTGWYAFTLNGNGDIIHGKQLLDATGLKAKATVKQGADGFKADEAGNIFSAGPDGINIITPAGKLVALIKIYNRRTSNCAFNETKDVLFVTADDVVLKIKIH